jgi:L-lactate dehydrogenase
MNDAARYSPVELEAFAEKVLRSTGLASEPARAVAHGLVEADLYGHDTHGLALLSDYVEEIANGTMEVSGRPEVLTKFGAVETWDARRLPGIWTTNLAVEAAVQAAEKFGLGAIAIRRSHHIACLATFLEQPARRKLLTMVFSSDPSSALVAPFGGTRPVMTPNPIAAGIPASPDPILIDISTSITTAGLCARLRTEGERLPHPWLLTPDGKTTDDPYVLGTGGSILPIGGLDHGHKGYALALLVEAVTQGLGGFGRAEAPKGWGASVFVLALAPQAFGPIEDFEREVKWLVQACRRSPPRAKGGSVRLPGETALKRKAQSIKSGIVIHPVVLKSLEALAVSRGLDFTTPLK